ncbi:hypothetical protein NQ318_023219 [Aromia moschata]|uniref:HTH CENPB-type domain-containing protein n=1 Tax=Aromia moschata TaxID=1265417 RepID=A0AAV8XMT1_9CUCU|nr:hypothetical protein NQ318_023219 [Aromia moschata]
MPTRYKRTGTCSRASWTEQQLSKAIKAVNENRLGVNEAARAFGVPATTLRRRKSKNNTRKGPLGPSSTLGDDVEAKIVKHIIKLQKNGFAPTRTDVRAMAFKLAEQLGIKHRFNKESGLAGFPWLQLFMQRNPTLSVRKAEGVSINRALGMNRKDVDGYFKLLEQIITENSLIGKPGHIFNMDETGLQLNNKPGHVIAKKGSKNIAGISSGEKGETITVISCCNAEGVFIPPTCVMKGKIKKPEFEDGMPPGSLVYMSQKSAYVNSEIFFQWLRDQFVPRKPIGVVLLLLDGHASHCSNVEMLEYCVEHDIILLCLPSHTTQFLQPLDRSFFKSLKLNDYSACNLYIKNNPGRKLTRLQFGQLLGDAWNKSATVNNAASAFRATGIVPFNPLAIPDYAFLTEHANVDIHETEVQNEAAMEVQNEAAMEVQNEAAMEEQNEVGMEEQHEPRAESPNKKTPEKCTPGKMLDNISPVPVVSASMNSVRRRGKHLAEILTESQTIVEKKIKQPREHKERGKKQRQLRSNLKSSR